MTVSGTTSTIQYAGNGATIAFNFPYVFFAPADLVVTLFDTAAQADVTPAPVLNGGGTYDYTVTGVLDAASGEYLSGATVTFNHAPLGSHRVTMRRVIAATQNLALIDNAKFPASSVNAELDRLTMLIQQNADSIGRAVLVPTSDTPGAVVLPPAGSRANGYLGFDSSGNPTIKPPPVVVTGTIPVMDGLITANNTLVDTATYDYAPVNNLTGAAITVLLKAAPADGDRVTVTDYAGNASVALPIIVSGNGHNIGLDATYQLIMPRQSVRLAYKNGKWLVS